MKRLISISVALLSVISALGATINLGKETILDINERIVNGNVAYHGQFPSTVFIGGFPSVPGATKFCMGILVAENKVLTHKSCTTGVRGFRFSFGRTDNAGYNEESEDLLLHQLDAANIKDHETEDVAIITIPHNIAVTSYVKVAVIPDTPVVGDTSVSTSGHGTAGVSLSTTLLFGTGKTLASNLCTPDAPTSGKFCYTLNLSADDPVMGVCSKELGGGVFDEAGNAIGINILGGCDVGALTNYALDLSTIKNWINTLQL